MCACDCSADSWCSWCKLVTCVPVDRWITWVPFNCNNDVSLCLGANATFCDPSPCLQCPDQRIFSTVRTEHGRHRNLLQIPQTKNALCCIMIVHIGLTPHPNYYYYCYCLLTPSASCSFRRRVPAYATAKAQAPSAQPAYACSSAHKLFSLFSHRNRTPSPHSI